MSRKPNIDQLINLLRHNFDPELISFELNIPIEFVNECKKQLEERESKSNTHKTNYVQQMRKKYNSLYSSTPIDSSTPAIQSSKDTLAINQSFSRISTFIQNLENSPNNKLTNQILLEIGKLEKCNLTIQQTEELCSIVSQLDDETINIPYKKRDIEETYKTYKKYRKIIKQAHNLLALSISSQLSSINDLQELEHLYKLFTPEFIKSNPALLGTVKMNIGNKIHKLQLSQPTMQSSSNIINATKNLEEENFDYEGTHQLLMLEVDELSKNRPNNKFALTNEQLYNQALSKLRSEITKNSESYKFVNPESTIRNLIQLQEGKSPELATHTLVMYFVNNSDFKSALELCKKYIERNNSETQLFHYYRSLKKQVLCSETSHIITQHLGRTTSQYEDDEFLEFLNNRLKKNKLNSSSIVLGTNPSTQKKITLSDISDSSLYDLPR